MRSGNIILNNLPKNIVGDYEENFIKDYIPENALLDVNIVTKRDPNFDCLYSMTRLQKRVWDEITSLVEQNKTKTIDTANHWVKVNFTDKDSMVYLTVYMYVGTNTVYNTVAFSRPLGRMCAWVYFPCSNAVERDAETIYGVPRKLIKEIITSQRKACGTYTYHYGMLGNPIGLVVGFDELDEKEQLTTTEDWLDENLSKEILSGAINASVRWLVEAHKENGNLSTEQMKENILTDLPESLKTLYRVSPHPISTNNVIDALSRKHSKTMNDEINKIIVERTLSEIGFWNLMNSQQNSFMKDLEGFGI